MYCSTCESPFEAVAVAAGWDIPLLSQGLNALLKVIINIMSLRQLSISFPEEPLSPVILSLHGGPEFLSYVSDIPSGLVGAYTIASCQLEGVATKSQADSAGQILKSLRELSETNVKVCWN